MQGIRRLAQHLDISIGTVSRALNGRPDVNEQTRQRVLEAAATLGYVPNQSGRALRKGTTGIVGFMIETDTKISVDGDSFFLSVFDGVQSVLASGSPFDPHIEAALPGPSLDHWFGTDASGRDIYTRVVFGARSSLLIGVGATALALLAAIAFGFAAGPVP